MVVGSNFGSMALVVGVAMVVTRGVILGMRVLVLDAIETEYVIVVDSIPEIFLNLVVKIIEFEDIIAVEVVSNFTNRGLKVLASTAAVGWVVLAATLILSTFSNLCLLITFLFGVNNGS